MHAKSNLNIDLYKSRKNIFDTPLCTLPPHAHGHTKPGIHHKKYLKDIDRINKTTLLKCVKPFDLIDLVEFIKPIIEWQKQIIHVNVSYSFFPNFHRYILDTMAAVSTSCPSSKDTVLALLSREVRFDNVQSQRLKRKQRALGSPNHSGAF